MKSIFTHLRTYIAIAFASAMVIGFVTLAVQPEQKKEKQEIVLSQDNVLVLNGPVTNESVTKLMEEATKLDSNLKSNYPIYLFLYTPGGSIQAGLELIEFLEGLNRPIHTITLFSASMGFQLIQHLGDRYVLKYGILMSHKARGAFMGEFGGTVSQVDSRYQLWIRRIALMDKKTVDRSKGKQTMESYTNSYTPELWLNGEEAVEKGYADAVVTVKCDLSLQGTKEETLDMGFVKVRAVLSKCPIKTTPVSVEADIATNKGFVPFKEFVQNKGLFGVDCVANSDEHLCALDKQLDVNKVQDEIKKRQEYLNRNLKDNVLYSY